MQEKVTLGQLVKEQLARKKRLQEAIDGGWRDCIASEQEIVDRFDYAMAQLITLNIEAICELAGHLDMGELPIGESCVFSEREDFA